MKQYTLIILMVLPCIACFGQGMFFDNLNNSVWTSGANMNDSIIRLTDKIGLEKFHTKESLKRNVTVWTFKNESLTIQYSDINLKKDSLIAIYQYEIDKDAGILKIVLNDNTILNYTAGIVSTGLYAELTRKKMRK